MFMGVINRKGAGIQPAPHYSFYCWAVTLSAACVVAVAHFAAGTRRGGRCPADRDVQERAIGEVRTHHAVQRVVRQRWRSLESELIAIGGTHETRVRELFELSPVVTEREPLVVEPSDDGYRVVPVS